MRVGRCFTPAEVKRDSSKTSRSTAAGLLLAALVLAARLPGPAVADAWKTFVSTSGRFTVLLPGPPREVDSREESPAGPVTKHLFRAQARRLQLSVEYSDVPAVAFWLGSRRRIFDHVERAFIADVKARRIRSSPATYMSHSGRQVWFEIPATGSRGELRLFLVKHRLYGLAGWYPKSAYADARPRLDRFFASFTAR